MLVGPSAGPRRTARPAPRCRTGCCVGTRTGRSSFQVGTSVTAISWASRRACSAPRRPARAGANTRSHHAAWLARPWSASARSAGERSTWASRRSTGTPSSSWRSTRLRTAPRTSPTGAWSRCRRTRSVSRWAAAASRPCLPPKRRITVCREPPATTGPGRRALHRPLPAIPGSQAAAAGAVTGRVHHPRLPDRPAGRHGQVPGRLPASITMWGRSLPAVVGLRGMSGGGDPEVVLGLQAGCNDRP
jgi:hypothetical protein